MWGSEEAFLIYGLGASAGKLPLSAVQESVLPEYRPALDQALKKLVRGEGEYSQEFRIKKADTWEIRYIYSKAELVLDASGAAVMVIGVMQDITERRQAEKKLLESEEQLRRSQKLDSMGRLAGGVAHDLNNLLGPILAYADFLGKSLPAGDRRLDDIAEIVKAADRAAALVRKLLAFSRKQVMEPKVIDVNAAVSEMEKMLKRVIGENVNLDSVLSSAIGPVKVDPGQLEQVILNLVLNARDAMPMGGDIRIETSLLDLKAPAQAVSGPVPAGRYLVLSVKDNGMGMDEATQKKIFEPFFTTTGPGKGVGLGLSTVYGIVKQSGGDIMVESSPGSGSVFRICFPLAEGEVEREQPAGQAKALTGKGGILVVEDDEQMRKIAKRILAAAGYSVLEAADGKEALRLLAEGGQPVGLMLTDMAMPGMDGIKLSLAVLDKYPGIKIICMSGYLEKEDEFREVLGGQAEFIEKPFNPQALVAKVNGLLK
jgi:PAS domain S-box-containing protein